MAEEKTEAEKIQDYLKTVLQKFVNKPITKKLMKDLQRTLEVSISELCKKDVNHIRFSVHGRVDGGMHILPDNLYTALVFNGVDVTGYNHEYINNNKDKNGRIYFVNDHGIFTWYEETENEHAHAKFVQHNSF
jgi:hypothetical protein